MAIEEVGSTNFSFQYMNISGSSRDIERLGVSQSGPELVGELSGTKFRGLSGDFSLINGQLQSSIFQVVNVNDGWERRIGYWTPQNGFVRNLSSKNKSRYSASDVSLGPIIWPGETTSAPKGWQVPMRGRKLRILVTVKRGFK
ncbi:putative periplasmic binding protein-like I [Rosa chinensis]|uniref:Putative periplasmic binding protein-like I n=1 Tax=Rosa chinensis TaxID=74649 RepID=A0A2P6Q1E2_ROSCH|nr:putative periplasmic binding protein-like I [Rosa chinensis]